MPPDHPAFNAFTSYKTLVRAYRNDKLKFRGRALYTTDDWQLRRTIICEGERCFLRDGIHRPYAYKDVPARIFTKVIGLYNAQVDEFKQFVVGEVYVTDPNSDIILESEEAESFDVTIDKLVERCGGKIVFTTNNEGERVINWYDEVGERSKQAIEFGSNLLDFLRTTANSDLATVIIPYGAKDETSGTRITIESVNEGLDFIQDDEAVALLGVITKAVYWDDVTTPEDLMTKAQQYLNESKNLIESLELTALDLSVLDKSIDDFDIGDIIEVRSKPHGLDGKCYQLTEMSLDLLHPKNDRIVLGKSTASLTGADAAGDKKGTNELKRAERIIRSDYAVDMESTKKSIMDDISKTYVTATGLKKAIAAGLPGSAVDLTMGFDLDMLTTPGFYVIPNVKVAESILHLPFSYTAVGSVIVIKEGDSGQLRQICRRCTEGDAKIYERVYSEKWDAWNKVYDGAGTILWSGGYYMQTGQTVTLSEPVSAQPSGIVLVFSRCINDEAKNWSFNSFFVPKALVAARSGAGNSFLMADSTFDVVASKYLFINDGYISGEDNNFAAGTANGITYDNGGFMLRYVIGV